MVAELNKHARTVYISTEKLNNAIFPKMLAVQYSLLVHQTFHLIKWLLSEVKPIVQSKWNELGAKHSLNLLTSFLGSIFVLVRLIQFHNLATQLYISIRKRNSVHTRIWQIVKYVQQTSQLCNFLNNFW